MSLRFRSCILHFISVLLLKLFTFTVYNHNITLDIFIQSDYMQKMIQITITCIYYSGASAIISKTLTISLLQKLLGLLNESESSVVTVSLLEF